MLSIKLCLSSALILTATLSGCVSQAVEPLQAQPPLTLHISLLSPDRLKAKYSLANPTIGLHFPQELGGYRNEVWQPAGSGFRWTKEADGERLERRDGSSFDRVTFDIPVDYRALPKSYAPFSPFSDGSALIHSGQFHACTQSPCSGTDELPISISARGKVIGVEGRRTRDRDRFVSRGEGTNFFVGTLQPVEADGFVAIIDPGLPGDLRQHLDRSLPQSIRFFEAVYGPLSFKPELYVSIDSRPEASGHQSTQGGTLPNQIFMHFDGETAQERLISGDPYWLDWFFAHEAAHLFQQDKIGKLAGDDVAAWLHEGGADAMAALAIIGRGRPERLHVLNREREAEKACASGLAMSPLSKATAEGNFDLHYQCGLVIWLALDRDLRSAGSDGLNDLNRAFFSRVKTGQAWNEPVFLQTAKELGVSESLLSRIVRLNEGRYNDASQEVEAVAILARQSLLADMPSR